MGWLNIYSSSLSSIEDTYQKQFVYIIDHSIDFIILGIDGNFMKNMPVSFCDFSIIVSLFLFGKIHGARCWYAIGFYNPTF
jgi:rod shape determining protein RodA